MAATYFSGPVISRAGFQTGTTGTALTKILKGTVSVTIATTAAAAEADITLTIAGVSLGDSVVLTPPDASAEVGLSIALVWVSAANTVKLRVSNLNAAAAFAGSTSNWSYLAVSIV